MGFIQKQAVVACLVGAFASNNGFAQDDAENSAPETPSWAGCLLMKSQAKLEAGLLKLRADKVFKLMEGNKDDYTYIVFPVPDACYKPKASEKPKAP